MIKIPVNVPNNQASTAERRAEVLSELVRLFSSGKDPLDLAEAAVELVASATGAKSVFVYFWEPDIERLVLRTVMRVDIDLTAIRVEMRLGEGLTGWSGLHRKPVILNSAIQEDPRFLAVDDVSETGYGSVIAAPIYDDSELYGVFALYASNENAFGDLEVAIAEEVGLLLASGLKRAETVKELELQSATARFLSDLPTSAGLSNSSAVRYSAKRVLELLNLNACVVIDPSVLSSSSDQIIIAEKIDGQIEPRITQTMSQIAARDAEIRFEKEGFQRMAAPLGYGFSRGLVMCFRSKPFSTEETRQLNALVAQIGLLLNSSGSMQQGASHVLPLLTAEDNKALTEHLTSLGWRQQTSLIALARIKRNSNNQDKFASLLQESITKVFGSETLLIQSGASLVLVISLQSIADDAEITQRCTTWLEDLRRDQGIVIEMGLGQISDANQDIFTSMEQARDALLWAQAGSTQSETHLVHFSEISRIRSLPRVLDSMKEEIAYLREKLQKLNEYDQQHGTKLLDTLEIFANLGGSVLKTSEDLFVHRNTLRQRLSRIEEVLTMSLSDTNHWTEMVLAAKLVRGARDQQTS